MSLSLVSEFDFISFARFWSDCQASLLSASVRHPDLELTSRKLVFFGGRSLDELAFRSYELYLLTEFAERHTLEDSVASKKRWDADCDAYLALLSLELGLHNYKAISRHSIWLILSSNSGSKHQTTEKGRTAKEVL